MKQMTLFPPASHTNDAWTSHAAEQEHTDSGARGPNCSTVYKLVQNNPLLTASELETIAPFDLQEVRRRLTDLKHASRVVQVGSRVSIGRRRAETTWNITNNGEA